MGSNIRDESPTRHKSSSAPMRARSVSPIIAQGPEPLITHFDGVTHVTPVVLTSEPSPPAPSGADCMSDIHVRPSADELLEREQALIDALLVRFKNIVELAAMPDVGVTKELAAAQAFQMKVESAALIRAAEDLLKLTRELKELWLFGPLRGLGEGEEETKLDENAKLVGEMLKTVQKLQVQAEEA